MGTAEPPLDLAVAEAMGTFDSLVAWYLDRQENRVVMIRDGVCSAHDLLRAAVEDDEERFIEIPAVGDGDDHGWMADFQEEQGSDWPHIRVDNRSGATRRFLKALGKNHPEAIEAWKVFRLVRLRAAAATWLADPA
jgi:uncharacterized protein UPF0158